LIIIFFFSSRRRHTRFSRDWSSDVCSSDLIGALSVLGEYQNLHRRDWQQTVQFSDSLIRVFGQSLAPLAVARDTGLVGLDLVPGAKRWFARKAMGTGSRRPVITPVESSKESLRDDR